MQQNLPNRTHCTGCSACFNACTHSAITMQKDQEGFLLPVIDETKCIDCNLCTKRCPVNNKPGFEESPKKVYAAYNLNPEQHQKSASGGIFSAFANYYYGLDNGIVCASAFDSNLHLRFILSSDKEDLKKLRGSKYVQSEVNLTYKEIRKLLNENKDVFFLGTPCLVAGLRGYLGREYENLFTVDLVCHGVPSPELFEMYLDSIGVITKEEYENFYFRSQQDSVYFVSSYKERGKAHVQVPIAKHSFICAYLKGWIHRESCYNCPFTGEHRQGDITIGDFWGILYGIVPFGRSRKHGVSMIMTNTTKGESMFAKIKNQLYVEEKTYEEALIENHNLEHPDQRPIERDFIYDELKKISPEEFMKKYSCVLNLPVPLWKRVLRKIKRIVKLQ